ncbi:MAG: A24 family peptidase [Tepidisphaeraceae bacterium]|jgi:prepilin peptidase CpaA
MSANLNLAMWMRMAPFLALLGVAAVTDILWRRIPNWLTVALMAAGLVRAAWLFGLQGLDHSALGLVVGGSLGFALFAMSALGGGDVKLLAAIGAWMGPKGVFLVFIVEAVVGLVIVLVQALAQGRVRTLFRNSALIAVNFAYASETGLGPVVESGRSMKSVSRPLPYAVPTLVATLLVLAYCT